MEMEASGVTLIQNFTLPGEICRKFALDWSADNRIALCTDRAVYVLTSYCSPLESGFPSTLHKQVIRAPEKAMELATAPPPSPDSGHDFDDQEQLLQVMLDHTVTPGHLERNQAFLGFRSARWSPRGAARGGHCMLAALTMDHRLMLYEEKGKEWTLVSDLSETLKTLNEDMMAPVAGTPKDARKGKKRKAAAAPRPNYAKLSADVYKLASVEITWTSMFGSPSTSMNDSNCEYCYLIVATKCGNILFWRVCPSDGKIVSLASEWDTGLGLITSLYWQQTSPTAGFLMCGSCRGILAFIPVSVRPSDDPQLVVKEMCKIWDEEDSVAVDHIAVLKIALKRYVIIAAKQQALVGCEIVFTDTTIVIRNVGHSFGLHNLPITGMCVAETTMPQYRVLVSSMDGLVLEIKVSLGNDQITFQHEQIEIDLDVRNMAIQGLATSLNGLLCAAALNTAVYHDHLTRREPLQFVMFITRPFDEIFEKLRAVLRPQLSFLGSGGAGAGGVARHSDLLECLRISLACGNALPPWMTAFLDHDPDTYDGCSPIELYFRRFLLNAYISGVAVSVPPHTGSLELKLYAVDAVLLRNYISGIVGRFEERIDLLTPAQGQSLLLMADWLFREFRVRADPVYAALGFEAPGEGGGEEEPRLPPRETCRICKGPVPLEDPKTGQCARGHLFARCCQSLLLCDVLPYHQCMACRSVALQDVWGCGTACTYCGTAMVAG